MTISTEGNQSDLVPEYWNDPNWIENAMVFDDRAGPAPTKAESVGDDPQQMDIVDVCFQSSSEQTLVEETTVSQDFIICQTFDSIPPGRQPAKVLKCGVTGCTSTALFDRHFEMKRHIEIHYRGQFPCNVAGCSRGQGNPFNRPDKLLDHVRKVHNTS